LKPWKYDKCHNKWFASKMVKELEEATSRKLFGYAGYVQAEHDYEQITMGDQCETFCFDWASVDPVYLNTLEMAFLELALVFLRRWSRW